ncbi:zeta toxin family protein [Francisella sp. TX07-6608]|uniref:zeta toxin family protein n=1 Tax=Francisella sp. TX07-6608 TaxID=573568 RepID=UPI000912152E|nr:zeta toxin family protein [Francisella sp. TX07-6608]OIN84749.1 zeta toxin family protein [Francisella sp. TX07-6608]
MKKSCKKCILISVIAVIILILIICSPVFASKMTLKRTTSLPSFGYKYREDNAIFEQLPSDLPNNLNCDLSPNEIESIYNLVLKRLQFSNVRSSSKQKVVLLVGQPGAGKSSVSKLIHQRMGSDGIININFDELMTFHPKYYHLTSHYIPRIYATIEMKKVISFARILREKLIKYCVEKRYNILFKNGFTEQAATQEIPNIVNKFNIKKIELYIVATPKKLSHLANYKRYQRQLNSFYNDRNLFESQHYDGPRRLSDVNSSNRADQFRYSVISLEQNKNLFSLISKITLLERYANIYFETEDTKNIENFYVKFQELFDEDVREQLLKEFEDFVSLFSKVYPIWLIS